MTTIDDPHLILDRIASIVENDMLVRLTYIEEFATREDLAESGAICKGHRACAIGALWIAGGLDPADHDAIEPDHDGCDIFGESYRDHYLSERPALEKAHDALNTAAESYAAEHGIRSGAHKWHSAIEGLFEDGLYEDGREIDPRELLTVIDLARSLLDA